MIASKFEEGFAQFLNRNLIAGNDGLQILSFFLSVFAVWVLARFFKSWLSSISRGGEAQSTRSVFLLSVGKALPFAWNLGRHPIGCLLDRIGRAGGIGPDHRILCLEVLLTISIALFAYYLVEVPSDGCTAKPRRPKASLTICLCPSSVRVSE